MVKIDAPLFSSDARGKLGYTLVYTKLNGKNVVKKYIKGTDLSTTEQVIERDIFLAGANTWRTLTPAEQAPYKDRAKGKALTGYNIYMSDYIIEQRRLLNYARYGQGKYGVNWYAP